MSTHSIPRKPVPITSATALLENEPKIRQDMKRSESETGHKITTEHRAYDAVVTDWWLLELLNLLISILILVGSVILLKLNDSRPFHQWRFGITLNTAIAVLSAFSSAAMMMPVTSAVSQLKWLWLAKANSSGLRLVDFQSLDTASKGGVWSSVMLMGRFWKAWV
jgi:hypothetical protein